MQITPHILFLVMIWTAIVAVLWIPLTWLLLSVFTPKSLLDRYFKQPHFTLTETYMMREFPGFLIRTSIWGWLLLIPSVDRKRGIKNIRSYMPFWYALGLRVLVVGAMLTGGLFLGLMGILYLLEDYAPDHVFFTLPFPF